MPFELRQRLLQWTWPTTDRDQYFLTHAGRDVITREGWEAFIRWVGQAMDRQLGAESEARVTITREGEHLIARFDDGRVLRHSDTIALADMLLAAGVAANAVQMPDWREGDSAPSSGERIAIFHRMRRKPDATGQRYEAAQCMSVGHPAPPNGYESWLDYAVATMDSRFVEVSRMFDDNSDAPSRRAMHDAAKAELGELRCRRKKC